MSVKAIIFDFDDTLFMTRQTRVGAAIYWSRKFYNIPIDENDVLMQWGKPFDEFIQGFIGKNEDLDQAKNRYYSILPKFPNRTYKGVPQLLRRLAKRYKLGMVSASSLGLILPEFEASGIDPKLFEFIQAQEHTRLHKPNPKVFAPIIKSFSRLNISKQEMIYVGDSDLDLEAAMGAGIRFIAIAGNTKPKDFWEKQDCEYIDNIINLSQVI
jgi:phosphoglycolate phosphatase-like HAD superfamily hydrolase